MELLFGFCFYFIDEEFVSYYLIRKIRNFDFFVRVIGEVDLNKCELWDFFGMYCLFKLNLIF